MGGGGEGDEGTLAVLNKMRTETGEKRRREVIQRQGKVERAGE